MKWALGMLFVIVTALSCSAQLEIPLGSQPPPANNPKTRSNARLLTGTVLDKSDKPIANAVVYLKNTKTLVMKTYIAQADGTYRFPELSRNVDYDVYAQKEGKKSSTKTLSQFDDRNTPNINLQIDTNK